MCDRQNPSDRTSGRRIIPIGVLPHFKIGLLGDFFRLAGIDEDSSDEAVNSGTSILIQQGERGLIAGRDLTQ